MGRMRCVFFVLLSLLLLLPADGLAQQQGLPGSQQGPEKGFQLDQNYPNPFNPETRIPFELYEDVFVDGRPATVSVRIYNILLQFVAVPTALNHPMGDRTPVMDLEYFTPGRYEVYWDGRDRSGNAVASGVYVLEMTVNGRSQTMKMFVSK
jgi:hypothetical protein